MGLDLVEIVMCLEEDFGIGIADTDAHRIRSPRSLADYICDRVPMDSKAPCQSQRAFHLLRQSLLRRTQSLRPDVKPNRLLKDLFGKGSKLDHLTRLRSDIDARNWPSASAVVLRRVRRVRDSIPYALTSNRFYWTREQVARRVKHVVVDQLGLKDGEYFEDADFIDDLGAG